MVALTPTPTIRPPRPASQRSFEPPAFANRAPPAAAVANPTASPTAARGRRHDFGGGGGGGGGRHAFSQASTGRFSSSPSWIIFCRASSAVHTLQKRVSVSTGTMAGVGSSVLSKRAVMVYVLPVTL